MNKIARLVFPTEAFINNPSALVMGIVSKILKNIFSISNEGVRKQVVIFGLKIKFKSEKLVARQKINLIESNVKTINNIVCNTVNISNMPKATGYIRIIQSIDFDILEEVNRICEKHNIPYWLDFGTLLGAIRHKGFIPWDDDLDISMLYPDYLRFQQVVEKELENTNYVYKKIPSHIGKILCKDFYPETDDKMLNFINWQEKENLYMALDIFPYHFVKESASDNLKEELAKARLEKIKLYEKYKDIKEFCKIQDFLESVNKKYSTDELSKKVYLGLEVIPSKIIIFNYTDIFPLIKVEFEGKYFYAPNKYKVLLQEYFDDFMKPVITHTHLDMNGICKEDKLRLLEYQTIEEKNEEVAGRNMVK